MVSSFEVSLLGNVDSRASHHDGGDAGGEAAADDGEPADRDRRCLLRGLIFSLIMVDTTTNNNRNTQTTTATFGRMLQIVCDEVHCIKTSQKT